MTSGQPSQHPIDYSTRATVWQLRTQALPLGRRPRLMGILNVTPDSFSDGGRHFDLGAAVEHGRRLVAEGADILDIGGESTRPFASRVSVDDELSRVRPVIERLAKECRVPISIDTSKARVAQAALDAGAEIINDVTALSGDREMLDVVCRAGAGVCVMHMQGTPQTMQIAPHYNDVVGEVASFLSARRNALLAAGIPIERIALDPGIGFGKTHQHNIDLLAACGSFHALGCPLLVGHSRKGFIARVISDKSADRLPGTIGVAIALANQGVQVIRVHDVGALRQALLVYEALGALGGGPARVGD